MQVLTLSGTPSQVGQQYGEACRAGFGILNEQARAVASSNHRWFSDIQLMKQTIGDHFPRVLEEMQGAAKGANLTLDDVLLNHRLFLQEGHVDAACCTNVAFLHPNAPVFGKNLDLAPNPERDLVIRDIVYEDGTRVVHSVVVGELTARDTCMNGAGLTFGGSSVGSVFQQSMRHVPIEAGLYAMLCSCSTVRQAIEFMRRIPWIGKGYNFVMVDAAGNGVALECALPLVQVRRPEANQDVVFCTNVYKLPSLAHADLRPPLGKHYSELRYRYLERALLEERVPRTVESMQTLLSAWGPQGGLCRPINEGDPSKTRMSVIALPAERKFAVADGQPCAVPFDPVWT